MWGHGVEPGNRDVPLRLGRATRQPDRDRRRPVLPLEGVAVPRDVVLVETPAFRVLRTGPRERRHFPRFADTSPPAKARLLSWLQQRR